MCLVSSMSSVFCFFFFNDTATTEIYTLSLHDALPISFDQAELHRVGADHKHDRDRRCRAPGGGGERHAAGYREDRDTSLDQLGGERRQAVVLFIGLAIVDDEVAVLDQARISQSVHKSYGGTDTGAGAHADPANDRKLGLRVHRERPGHRTGHRRRGRPAKDLWTD